MAPCPTACPAAGSGTITSWPLSFTVQPKSRWAAVGDFFTVRRPAAEAEGKIPGRCAAVTGNWTDQAGDIRRIIERRKRRGITKETGTQAVRRSRAHPDQRLKSA